MGALFAPPSGDALAPVRHETARTTSGRILDISSQGVGLIVDRSFAQGSVLVLRFPGSSLESRPILVRVKHLQPLDNGEFKVGCTFVVPLSDEQLAEFI